MVNGTATPQGGLVREKVNPGENEPGFLGAFSRLLGFFHSVGDFCIFISFMEP